MRLDMSQHMKMDQRMVLAPRMIQSMEILQLPLLALQERIEQEMLTNPVLELEEPAGEQADQDVNQENSAANSDITESEQSLSIKEDNSNKEDFQRLDNLGSDYEDYLERAYAPPRRRTSGDRDPKMEAMQNTAAPGQSLNEFLHEQWLFMECEPIIKKAGVVIIDYIDETGYLSVELKTLSEHVRQPINSVQLEQALAIVQKLDPPGVGARNLAECLLIQLQNTNEDRSLEIELVKNHLKDIEMNRFPDIARKTGRSINDIKLAIQTISHLDPHPGTQIGNRITTYIMPEVIVEYDEDNDNYHARLSDGSSPSLQINNLYGKMLKNGKLTRDAKEYLQNSIRSARWLIESIEQRKATLLRVVNHVLRNQKDFFDQGPQYLKPLPMVDVAAELGIHVGTVSRAVSGKYLQTPIGIYPLRYFFSGGTETANGESVSWDAVRAKLQEIIDNEDKSNPFNDDQLVRELQKHGLKLARRTIAKYRGMMSIPPARRRRIFE